MSKRHKGNKKRPAKDAEKITQTGVKRAKVAKSRV